MNQADHIERARRNALWVFGFASLLALSLGAMVMALSDVPQGLWIRNPIAWVIAAGFAIVLARCGWLGPALLPIAVSVLALSFFGAGQQGVHRWLDLGQVQLNAAALVLPVAILAMSRAGDALACACVVLIATLLAWQPDISQLVGFALAMLALAPARKSGRLAFAIAATVIAVAVALCLSRPDPLAPVAHVEGIFGLAWYQSPGLAIIMGVSLAAAALSPLIVWAAHPIGLIAPLALAVYLATTAAAFLFGAYPVPLAGYGLSFVIGWWLGIAALCVRRAG